MSFVSQTRRAPRYGVPGGVRGPLGDIAPPSVADRVSELQRQLGRFVGATVNGKRFQIPRIPVTGTLDLVTAQWAVLVLQQRNLAAYKDIPTDQATANLLGASLAAVANPVPFVKNDLDGTLAVVAGFADYLGLSNEQGAVSAIVRRVGGTRNAALLAAGGGALLYLLVNRRKRRRGGR